MPVEFGTAGLPVGVTHGDRETLSCQRVGGNGVHLVVAEHLQSILQPPQEHICGLEFLGDARGQQLAAGELRKHREQRWCLHAPVLPAADQLERLHDEFDLADSARP